MVRASGKILPAYYDDVFRWVFGSQRHVRSLAKFLRAALPDLPASEWSELALPDTHMVGAGDRKELVFDVLTTTASGRSVDVELQMAKVPAVRERFTLYNSRLLAEQAVRGQDYTALRPVVTLVVCGFVMFDQDEHYLHTFVDYDVERQVRFTRLRETRTIELPKLPAVDDGTDLWDWLRLIVAKDEEEIDMAAAGNPDVAEAAVLVKQFSADETRRYLAMCHDKFLSDWATREAVARREGLAEGRREAVAQRDRAVRAMVAEGVPVERVAVALGVSPDEVAAIVGAG
ncbi:MAG: Rpn family recombination-promoting nuclease/putative transposase [Micrococcales bacterium]|nr:Rpn family recombination-promoting nuclease/putative transposase [Micrococcales bacterium]